MNIQAKVRKGKMLYTFVVTTKDNYKGKISEIDEEKKWFLNQIKECIKEVEK